MTLALAPMACSANRPAVTQRAALLVERGQEREAAALLQRHLAEHPRDVEPRRLLIRVLAASADLGAAEREARVLAEQLGRESPLPWIELGHAFELAHDYDAALALYDKAAEVAPKDPAGPLAGGLRAARWGEVELAAPRLEEALRRDARNARAWHALGLVRAKQGLHEGARSAYRSGLQADPNAIENHVGLATVALALHQPAEALIEYEKIVEARPRFADAHLGRSWSLMLLGRLDEAEQALDLGYRLGANKEVVRAQRGALETLRARAAKGGEL
jgi:tetratricopeptide (TPR) repeat protein